MPMKEIDLNVPCSTALACGFFDFRAPLNHLFLDSFPDYVIASQERQELTEVRPLFELLRKEAHAGTLHSRKLRSFTEPAFR